MKTFLWALLIASAWIAWFIGEAFLVDSIAGPVLDSRELRLLVPHLLASVFAGVVPALALRGRLQSIRATVSWRIVLALMLLIAPVGVVIHLVLPRANWFWTALCLALYIGASQALLFRRIARGTYSLVLGTTIGVFAAIVIAKGEIWDITFLPVATLAVGIGQSLAMRSLRPVHGVEPTPQ